MKAKIRIELPPGVVDTYDVRAALAAGVAEHLGCGHDHDEGDLEKSAKKPPRELPHRAPQMMVDRAVKLYERTMRTMLDEIAAVLSE